MTSPTSPCAISGCTQSLSGAIAPLVVPLPWLPDITPCWTLKGIEPHRDTEAYLDAYTALDRALQQNGASTAERTALLEQQAALTTALMDRNPFISSGNTGALEKFKTRLRARTGLESARDSAHLLLSSEHLKRSPWSQERSSGASRSCRWWKATTGEASMRTDAPVI